MAPAPSQQRARARACRRQLVPVLIDARVTLVHRSASGATRRTRPDIAVAVVAVRTHAFSKEAKAGVRYTAWQAVPVASSAQATRRARMSQTAFGSLTIAAIAAAARTFAAFAALYTVLINEVLQSENDK